MGCAVQSRKTGLVSAWTSFLPNLSQARTTEELYCSMGQPPIPGMQNRVWDGGLQSRFKGIEQGGLIPASQT